jgi:hypothetical protein
MVRLSDLRWRGLAWRIQQGEVIANEELADAVERSGARGIPDDVRALIAERLRAMPHPKRPRGRPAQTENDRRAHLLRALILESMLHFEWARLGGRRGKKGDALDHVASEAGLKTSTLTRILSHDAPAARAAAKRDPTLWWPLSDPARQALADARAKGRKRD